MAITPTDFVAAYPQFEELNTLRPGVITAALADARPYCSETLWGTRYQAGVFCKAAHLICMQPFGENARLKGKNETTHGQVFKEMLAALPVRVGVSGGFPGGY